MTIREQLEQQELEYLSPDACPNIGAASAKCRGWPIRANLSTRC